MHVHCNSAILRNEVKRVCDEDDDQDQLYSNKIRIRVFSMIFVWQIRSNLESGEASVSI